MTPRQVARFFLCCERDDQGRVMPESGTATPSLPTTEDLFRRYWGNQGLRPEQVDRLWQEHVETNPDGDPG